jgi:hypothetical protein
MAMVAASTRIDHLSPRTPASQLLKKVMAVEAEEEVSLEVEEAMVVCSDDCRVLCDLPPHLVIHMPPRTAADSSQQVQE